MKTTTALKKLYLLSFALLIIVSCSDAVEKISPAKTKKETAAIKDTPGPVKKKDIQKWNSNASTAQIKFSVKGPFGTVDGSLGNLKSTILFDKDNLTASTIRASTDPKTISTGIKLRNKDLQKEKYFNSDKYTLLSFQSDKIQKSGTGYKAIGDLTIKGVTKKIEIPFSFSEKGSTVSIDLEVPVTK